MVWEKLSSVWIFAVPYTIVVGSTIFVLCCGCWSLAKESLTYLEVLKNCFCGWLKRWLHMVIELNITRTNHFIWNNFFSFPVNDNQQNINVLRGLALQLQDIVNQENQKCWGKPLGSPNLWNENVRTIKRIQSITSQIKIKEVWFEVFFRENLFLIKFYHFSRVQKFVQQLMTYLKNVFEKLFLE